MFSTEFRKILSYQKFHENPSIGSRVFFVRRQSIKKLNFLNSEPASARSTLAMVALCSWDIKLYSDASSITPCQLVIELDELECVCVCLVPSAIFCKLKNEGS